MKLKTCILFILTGLLAGVGCIKKEVVYVINLEAKDPVLKNASAILVDHLSSAIPSLQFKTADAIIADNKCIVLEIINNDSPGNKEGFTISGTGNRLILSGKTPRAVLNAVYGLLERVGYGFYLSFKTLPVTQKQFDFEKYNFSDKPLTSERIAFNWHNFLSGCSAWNFKEWKELIDNASAMRFNTIMVHTYGNNPMFSWSFNGIQKKTSPMPATQGGRDYGTQQVNDVRRLYGGEVFDDRVFGSDIAKMDPDLQPAALQKMMKDVFNYAKGLGLKVCFAFDLDTYPANPQELICTLPSSARFSIPLEPNEYAGRYNQSITFANPDTPEGYDYYKKQLTTLLELYPMIDEVALWMRKSGSEWLLIQEDQLPEAWQIEYRNIKTAHPELAEFEDAPGRFALSRVVYAIQRALKETERTDIVLKAGSWEFGWMEPTHLLFPEDVGFIGLDYNIIRGKSDIDVPEVQKLMAGISQNREVTPIFWAHHDDGAYMGRPYAPVDSLPDKLGKVNAAGYGIIHWTTWPLDPYFKNMSRQVWEGTRNEDYRSTTSKMSGDLFGREQPEQPAAYLYQWAIAAPMMGRETREWFVDHEFTGQETKEVIKGCNQRLKILGTIKPEALSEIGKKYLAYFKGFEEFSKDFFLTEYNYQQSLKFLAEGNYAQANESINRCNPEKLVEKFALISLQKGITSGEKGLILSLNTEWLPYIDNQRQALGIATVLYSFGPTVHPGFGQGLLLTSFFADSEHRLWRILGKNETDAREIVISEGLRFSGGELTSESMEDLFRTGIVCDSTLRIELKPSMADLKPIGILKNQVPDKFSPGTYQLDLFLYPENQGAEKETILKIMVFSGFSQILIINDMVVFKPSTGYGIPVIKKSYRITFGEGDRAIMELRKVRNQAVMSALMLKKMK